MPIELAFLRLFDCGLQAAWQRRSEGSSGSGTPAHDDYPRGFKIEEADTDRGRHLPGGLCFHAAHLPD